MSSGNELKIELAKTGITQRRLADHLGVDERDLSIAANLGPIIDIHNRAVEALRCITTVQHLSELPKGVKTVAITVGRGWYKDKVNETMRVYGIDADTYQVYLSNKLKILKSDTCVVTVRGGSL